MKYDVVGIGVTVSDYLINIEEMPRENGSCSIISESWQFGGKVATAMAALGRLGVPCAMMSVLGDDADGKAQLEDFAFNGVDTSYIVVDPEYQTRACVALSQRKNQSRMFFLQPRRSRHIRPDELPREVIQSARFLHLHYADDGSRQAADWMREAGGTVVFDADDYFESIFEMLPKIDVFIASENYTKGKYPGIDELECCRLLMQEGPSTVIVTVGERGCVGISPEGEFSVPAFKVDVVDTTGAGDVFHAGYIYGLLNGWPAVKSARWASAMSAIKCTSIGGRSGLPTREMVERFLEDGTIDSEEIKKRVAHYARMPYLK